MANPMSFSGKRKKDSKCLLEDVRATRMMEVSLRGCRGHQNDVRAPLRM